MAAGGHSEADGMAGDKRPGGADRGDSMSNATHLLTLRRVSFLVCFPNFGEEPFNFFLPYQRYKGTQ